MRLSRKKAIELCIELWTWLAETGAKHKSQWPEWSKYLKYNIPRNSGTYHECWLCEYAYQVKRRKPESINDKCEYCLYNKKYGLCCAIGEFHYFKEWDNAKQSRTRKKYAKLFLGQIKKCK